MLKVRSESSVDVVSSSLQFDINNIATEKCFWHQANTNMDLTTISCNFLYNEYIIRNKNNRTKAYLNCMKCISKKTRLGAMDSQNK